MMCLMTLVLVCSVSRYEEGRGYRRIAPLMTEEMRYGLSMSSLRTLSV